MAAIATKKAPVHPTAVAALAVSLLAIVLAFYGSLAAEKHVAGSPLNEARGGAGLGLTQKNTARYTVRIVAFVLPIVLGIGGAVAGGRGMRLIEKADGRYRGDAAAVFAIFIGGFAAVIAGCMSLAVFGWRHVPSLYTT